jgi:hypothetical protein
VAAIRDVNGQTEGRAYLASLSPSLRQQLEKDGQVLMGENKSTDTSYGGYIKAIALFKQPKARAWALIVAPSRQPLYLPRLTSARVLETPANGELDEFRLKVFIASFVLHTRHWFYPEQSRVEWSLDKAYKSDINRQEGYWQLFAVNDGLTVAEYGTLVDTGIAAPRSIQDYLARRDIPTALQAFRAYIDSDGRYRRPE